MTETHIDNFGTAIANIGLELVAAGVEPEAVADTIAHALGTTLASYFTPEQSAAMLRVQASKIEALIPREGMTPDAIEMTGLARKGHEFINALQVAGIDERTAVAALVNVCIERVTRSHGALGASGFLRRMAGMAEANATTIETTARSH